MKWCLLFLFFATSLSCFAQNKPENAAIWQKIHLDFKSLDKDGMLGAAGSKVEQHYEFCIPASRKHWKAIKKTDPTAKRNQGKGRIGCTASEWLIIGCTHQQNYQRVLYNLASFPFINRIEPVYWE